MRNLHYLSFAFKKQGLLFLLQILAYSFFAQQNIPTKVEDYTIVANLDSLEKVVFAQKTTPSVFLHELIKLELNRNTRSEKFGQNLDTIKVLAQLQSSELGLMMYEYLRSFNFSKNNLEEGMRISIKIMDYFEQKKDTLGMLSAYQQMIKMNVSASSKITGSKENAKKYLLKAIDLGKNSLSPNVKLTALRLELTYHFDVLQSTDIASATAVVHEAEQVIDRNPQYEFQRYLFYSALAYLYHKKKMYREELLYYQKAYQLILNAPSKTRLVNLMNLGIAYSVNSKLADTEKTFREAINLYKISKEDRPELLSTLHLYLSESLHRQQKYKDAWLIRNVSDSLNKIAQEKVKSRNLLEIQTKYETEKKELENKHLALEADKQKQKAMILGLLAVLFILISGVTVWTYRKVNGKNIELQRLNDLTSSQNKDLIKANQRMEHFTNTLSHDALGYINHILNYTQLSQNMATQTELSLSLQKVLQNAMSLKNMSENLVSYNRTAHNIQLEKIDLNDIVTEVAEDTAFELSNSDIRIESQDLPNIYANREFIKQVFRNLIINAIKFKKKDIPLNIEISKQESTNSDFIEILVKDNGAGIAAEKLPFIFDEFVRGDNKIGGSGLGLYICRQIIEKMGGKIWVESQLGGGTTFHFTLQKG